MLNKVFMIAIQILFIFVFLTVFFFTYVNSVEKDVFQTQMNIVVDSVFDDDIDIKSMVSNFNDNDVAIVTLDGSLDLAKKISMDSLKNSDADISYNNDQIQKKAYSWVIISVLIFLFITLILYLTKFKIDFKSHTVDALINVFFVGMTELLFLIFITKKYYSVDPNDVKFKLGKSIQNYIKNKK